MSEKMTTAEMVARCKAIATGYWPPGKNQRALRQFLAQIADRLEAYELALRPFAEAGRAFADEDGQQWLRTTFEETSLEVRHLHDACRVMDEKT